METAANPIGQSKPRTEAAGEQSSLGRILVVDKPRFSELISRMLAGRMEVVCVEDALAALGVYHRNRPDLIVADLNVRGGGLRLAELLEMSVAGSHTPFVLTCIKPQADLVDRVKQVGIDTLLVKPFPPRTLMERIGALLRAAGPAAEVDETQPLMQTIRAKTRWIDGLPSLPSAHNQIRLLADSKAEDEGAEKARLSPAGVERLVALANCVREVFPHRVNSIKQAVASGGEHEVSGLLMAQEVYQELGQAQPASGFDAAASKFDAGAFWKHSVGTGFIARSIGRKLKVEESSCFLSGLLHDVGKKVMDRFFTDFHTRALELSRKRFVHSVLAESEVLGVDHAHLGGYLAVNWQFSDPVTEAIACHHDPTRAKDYPKMASVAHVANAICNHLGYGSSGEVVRVNEDDPVLYRALLKLGVGPNVFEQLIELGKERLEDADGFLEVLTGKGTD